MRENPGSKLAALLLMLDRAGRTRKKRRLRFKPYVVSSEAESKERKGLVNLIIYRTYLDTTTNHKQETSWWQYRLPDHKVLFILYYLNCELTVGVKRLHAGACVYFTINF